MSITQQQAVTIRESIIEELTERNVLSAHDVSVVQEVIDIMLEPVVDMLDN